MSTEKDNFTYILIVSIIILFFLFYTAKIFLFFGPAIVISLFVIFVTKPIYLPLERLTKNRTLSVIITIALVIIVLSIFSFKTYSIAINETQTILSIPEVNNVIENNFNINITTLNSSEGNKWNLDYIKEILEDAVYSSSLEGTDYQEKLIGYVSIGSKVALGAGYILLQLITAFLMTFYIVRYRLSLNDFILRITPQKYKIITNRFIRELTLSLNSIFMGIFLTGVLTGAAQYIILTIFNVPYPFFLSVITGLLTLVPIIGGWAVYGPITIFMVLNGNIDTAVLFFILSMIFVGAIPDSITKPLLIAREGRMNILLVIISFIGGAGVFGPIGLFLGPIIVAITLSFIYSLDDGTKKLIKPIYGEDDKKKKDGKTKRKTKQNTYSGFDYVKVKSLLR